MSARLAYHGFLSVRMSKKRSVVNNITIYEVQLTQESLSNQATFTWSAQRIHVTNMNTSEICMWNFFALTRNSQSCRFLLEWLDFAREILNNSKCDLTFIKHCLYIWSLIYTCTWLHTASLRWLCALLPKWTRLLYLTCSLLYYSLKPLGATWSNCPLNHQEPAVRCKVLKTCTLGGLNH